MEEKKKELIIANVAPRPWGLDVEGKEGEKGKTFKKRIYLIFTINKVRESLKHFVP